MSKHHLRNRLEELFSSREPDQPVELPAEQPAKESAPSTQPPRMPAPTPEVADTPREAPLAKIEESSQTQMIEALRQSEEKYRTILDNIEDGYYEVDLKGSFVFFNDALCRILGYSRDELMGMNYREYMDAESSERAFRAFNGVYRTGEPLKEFEYVLIENTGAKRYIDISVSLIRDAGGEPVGFRGVLRDITERRQAGAERERRAVQLQTAAEIARAATSILNVDELLDTTVNLIRDRFNLYYVGLFLVDEARENAILRAGTGDMGRAMLESGHHLAIGSSSMIGWCVANQKARIALDVGAEAARFENPLLPETRSELALPLVVRGQALGAMTVQSAEEAAFGEADIAVLQTMADQIANAIANADLLEETRTRAEEAMALNDLSRALAARLNIDQVLEEVYRGVSRLLDTTNFYFGLYDPSKNEVSFPINVTESVIDRQIATMPAGQGLTGYLIRNRTSLLIREDVAGYLAELGIEAVGEIAKSWLGVPLMIGDQVLGVMAVQSYTAHRLYDEHDRDMLTAISSQAAIAVQNARLFEQAQTALAEAHGRAQRERLVSDIISKIRAAISVEEVLRVATDELRQVTGATRAVARLSTPTSGSGNGHAE